VAGYCGRCGTPFTVGHGPFCRTCGNRLGAQPGVAVSYSYPVVPAASVPAAQHKLSHSRLVIFGGAALAVLVVLITAIAVSQKPTTTYCHYDCGPDVGPRLLSSTAYQSSQFGYRVEYQSGALKVEGSSATGLELQGPAGSIVFSATSGQDVTGAITTALGNINTNVLQDMRSFSSQIPGAEIGEVPAQGQVYTATYVPPNGGQSVPASVAVMAATNGQFTISVLVIGAQDSSSVTNAPFDFADNQVYDFAISNTVWPGQQ
jgi:hypothetical protein